MGRNSELIRQWTLLRQLAAMRTNTIPKLAEDLNVTTRTVRRDLAALQTAGFPDLRRNRQRHEVLADGPQGHGRAGAQRADVLRAVRAVFQPRAARVFRRHAAAPRSAERARQVRGGALAGDEEVPRSAAARHHGEGAAGEAAGHADLPDDGEAARSERGAARRLDALPLAGERAREGVPRSPVPAGACAGRAVSHRLRAGLRGGAHVRRRADPARDRCRSRRSSRWPSSIPTRSRTRSASIAARP